MQYGGEGKLKWCASDHHWFAYLANCIYANINEQNIYFITKMIAAIDLTIVFYGADNFYAMSTIKECPFFNNNKHTTQITNLVFLKKKLSKTQNIFSSAQYKCMLCQ